MSAPSNSSASEAARARKRSLKDRVLGCMVHDVTGQTQSKRQRTKLFANYTDFAKKYGHPRGISKLRIDHTILKYTGKSGLSPLSPGKYRQSDATTKEEERRRQGAKRLREYQRKVLLGFTSEELHKMDALPGMDARKMEFQLSTVPIHPMLAQCQWLADSKLPEHESTIALWVGDLGSSWFVRLFFAGNPTVWQILEPILQLATMILTTAADSECMYFRRLPLFRHSTSGEARCRNTSETDTLDYILTSVITIGFDALLHGSYQMLTEQPGMGGPRHCFFSRNPEKRILDSQTPYFKTKAIQELFTSMQRLVRFGIYSRHQTGNENDRLSSDPDRFNYGRTTRNIILRRMEIHISVEDLEPLLTGNLTDAEILAQRFAVSNTIVHEIAHAAYATLRLLSFRTASFPSFRDTLEDSIADRYCDQLGYSLTHHIFGGEVEELVHPTRSMGGPGLAPFAAAKGSFFNKDNLYYGRNAGYRRPTTEPPPANNLDSFMIKEHWAIPNNWYATIVTWELWDQKVRSYGLKALEIGPLKYGLRWLPGSVENLMMKNIEGKGLVTTIESFEAILHGSIVLGDPKAKQQEVAEENKRLMKGQQITEALSVLKLESSDVRKSDNGRGRDTEVALEDRVKTVPEYPEIRIGSSQLTQPCPRFEEIKA
ncbi:hypothetical protein VTL71DRAFT_6193 [Oculimacula yallundae]|uniref:Uncharacterized protein n=1 Tax=Oculimacula yallundae TaxID=86028 RepID=A0ABR4C167_9HELO